MISNFDRPPIIKVALQCLLITGVGWSVIFLFLGSYLYVESQSSQQKINFSNERLALTAQKRIETQFQNQIHNILFLTSISTHSITSHSEEKNFHELADIFSQFIQNHPSSAQVRFIDSNGMEVVRVDRLNGEAHVMSSSELQNKSERYYFSDASSLSKAGVAISRLDLNVERGLIEEPHRPMIRLSSPVFSSRDQLLGILVVNFSVQRLINELNQMPTSQAQRLWLLDERLDWIIAPEAQKSWGTQLDLTDHNLKAFLPNLVRSNARSSEIVQGHFNDQGRSLYIARSSPFSLNESTKRVAIINRASHFYLIASQPQPDIWALRVFENTELFKLSISLMIMVFMMAVLIGVGSYKRYVLAQKNLYQRGLMKGFFEHSPEIMMISNSSGELVYSNPNADELIKHREAFSGRSTEMGLNVDERAALWKKVSNDKDCGTKCELCVQLRSDPRYFYRQCFFINNENGDEKLLAVILSEITQFKVSEKKRRESEEKFRHLLEAAPDAIVLSDSQGKILLTNRKAQHVFEISQPDFLGQSIESLVPTEYQSAHQTLRTGYFKEPANRMMSSKRRVFAQTSSGRRFEAEISLSPFIQNGEHQVISIVRDVSERIKLEGHLKQAQKLDAMGQLTGGMAHDFNNLLTTIIGNLDSAEVNLQQGSADRQKVSKNLSTALNASLKASSLTKRLLAFSRKQPLFSEVTHLGGYLERELEIFLSAVGKMINLRLEYKGQHWLIMVDPQALTSAIINLAVNAKDAMPQGGDICISIEDIVFEESYADSGSEVIPAGEYVLLTFSDTGHGIKTEQLDKIFEPFYTTKPKGTGLGLSMLFSFVKQSNGYLNVSSQEMVGTSVKLYFPRYLAPEKETERRDYNAIVGLEP